MIILFRGNDFFPSNDIFQCLLFKIKHICDIMFMRQNCYHIFGLQLLIGSPLKVGTFYMMLENVCISILSPPFLLILLLYNILNIKARIPPFLNILGEIQIIQISELSTLPKPRFCSSKIIRYTKKRKSHGLPLNSTNNLIYIFSR